MRRCLFGIGVATWLAARGAEVSTAATASWKFDADRLGRGIELAEEGRLALLVHASRGGKGAVALCGPPLLPGSGTYTIGFKFLSASEGTLDPGTRVGVFSGGGGPGSLDAALGNKGMSWGYAADGDLMHGGSWLGLGSTLGTPSGYPWTTPKKG